MEVGNSREVNLILRQYKLPSGEINYPTVFAIPIHKRIPALFETNFAHITAIIVGALTMFVERMGFKKEFNEVQLHNLAEEIIDTSTEDNLSVEDLMLFLQDMVRGKYGVFDSMSIPRFMKTFEAYRQERHSMILNIRDNEHLQYKGLGDANRTGKADPLAEHFSRMASTISTMKENMKELRTENRTMKQADKFYKDK